MAYVPVAGTVMVELIQTLDTEIIENTLYFEQTGAWTVAALNTLGADIASWWETDVAPSMSAALGLQRVELTDLTTQTAAAVTVTTGLPVFGVHDLEASPNNVAPAISFHTANRGRSFRGRNYLSGIPSDHVVINRVQGTTIAALTAAYNALLGVATGNACTWVVVSRYSGIDPVTKKPIPRAAGVATPIEVAVFTDTVVDSQRNRLPNR